MDNKSQRGQSLVEFAIGLPIVVLLIFGAILLAQIQPAQVALKSAADYGAQAAILWEPEDGINCEQAVINAVTSRMATIGSPVIQVEGCPTSGRVQRGDYVTVTLNYTWEPIFFSTFLNPATPRTLTLVETTSLRKW
jgi:Flp pilus assembly protein TadG